MRIQILIFAYMLISAAAIAQTLAREAASVATTDGTLSSAQTSGQTKGGYVYNSSTWLVRQQPAPPVGPDARQQVRQTVDSLMADLGKLDFQALARHLAPKALVVIVRKRDSESESVYLSGEEWIGRLRASAREPFEEKLSNVQITVEDDSLAQVRAEFQIVRQGKIESHGVDQFTLVKERTGWKVAVIAFTSKPGPVR